METVETYELIEGCKYWDYPQGKPYSTLLKLEIKDTVQGVLKFRQLDGCMRYRQNSEGYVLYPLKIQWQWHKPTQRMERGTIIRRNSPSSMPDLNEKSKARQIINEKIEAGESLENKRKVLIKMKRHDAKKKSKKKRHT